MRFASLAAQKRFCVYVFAGFVCSSPFQAARAAEPASFVIPAGEDEGYGIGECMKAGSACGRVIADSWCEAHGHAKAIAFGSADDITGSVSGTDQVTKISAGDIVIRCGE